MELAQRTYTEPIDVVHQALQYVRGATNPRATIARINQVVTYSPGNFPTELQKMKFAKEAISNKAEFVPSAIGFDNAYPEHREQKFNGDSGWHTWMVQRIDNITAEAARIGDHSTHVNHLQQTQVEDLTMNFNYLNQRLNDLETETTNVNHVTANQQEEDKGNNKKKQIDKSKYKYYCFFHGHTKNQNHTSATCTRLIVDETFRFGKNQGKLITAAMKGATEPGTIDGAEGCNDYFTPFYYKFKGK